MRRYTFDVARHEEFGTLGLTPRWYRNGDPLGGMAAAHDILEHFKNDDGQITGELLAFGATMFIRGDGAYFTNGGEVENLSGEIGDIWWRFMDRRESFPDCPPSRDAEVRQRAAAIIGKGIEHMRYRFEEGDLPSPDHRARMERWLCRGYRLARRRYRSHRTDAATLAWFFRQVEEACDKAIKHAEEGMVCEVFISVLRCDFRVDCDYPKESW